MIGDYSISRNHGTLKIIGNNFYFSDLTSKFGSFLRMKKKIDLIPNRQLAVVYNNILLNFQVTKKLCYFSFCTEYFSIKIEIKKSMKIKIIKNMLMIQLTRKNLHQNADFIRKLLPLQII